MFFDNYDVVQKIVTKLKALPELFTALVQKVDANSQAVESALTTSDIANNLTTETVGKVLDATQGKALKDAVDKLSGYKHIVSTSLETVDVGNVAQGVTKTSVKTITKPTGANNWLPMMMYTQGAGGSTFLRSVWFTNTTTTTVDLNVAVTNDGSADTTDCSASVTIIWLGV